MLVFAIGFAVLGIILVALLAWGTRKLYKLLIQNWSVFGSTPQARLVGLGIAVAFFPQMVWGPLDAALRVGQGFLGNAQAASAPLLAALSNTSASGFPAQTAAQALGAIANLLAQALSNVVFPFTQLILGLACWSVAGQVLSGKSNNGVDWTALLQRMSGTAWKNVALFAVLLVGCYLSISAIAAIPSLQKAETPVEADRARLTDLLKLSRSSRNDFAFQPPTDGHPFQRLDGLLKMPGSTSAARSGGVEPAPGGVGAKPINPSPSGAAPAINPNPVSEGPVVAENALINDAISANEGFRSEIEQVRQRVSAEDDVRARFRGELKDLQDKVKQQEENLETKVAAVFDGGTVGHMGARDRSRYIRTLDSDFQRRIVEMETPLRNCAFAVGNLESYWESLGNALAAAVTNDARSLKISSKRGASQSETSSFLNSMTFPPVEDSCQGLPLGDYIPPNPPSAGDDWGIFRFFAGWLLRSESLALTLIAGMLGAGLLGSASSSFIREKKDKKEGDPLVNDLAGVVIRGFSAAIVIYLAVEGGLNVFGATAAEPNPYVLLCTCLVGAVFSEDVWDKAHEWLKKKPEAPNGAEPNTPQKQNQAGAGQTDKNKQTAPVSTIAEGNPKPA